MRILAILALIWVVILVLGTAFSILGKLIWLGVLLSVLAGIWSFVKRDKLE
jgi:hypothetical protein